MRKRRRLILCGATLLGAIAFYRINYKMPRKDYTAACLYLAVMDDEICRNELENNKVNGSIIRFPPKYESLQQRYHTFLSMNKGNSRKELQQQMKDTENRLKVSRQYIGRPQVELEVEIGF